jgi:hypothetical protein
MDDKEKDSEYLSGIPLDDLEMLTEHGRTPTKLEVHRFIESLGYVKLSPIVDLEGEIEKIYRRIIADCGGFCLKEHLKRDCTELSTLLHSYIAQHDKEKRGMDNKPAEELSRAEIQIQEYEQGLAADKGETPQA